MGALDDEIERLLAGDPDENPIPARALVNVADPPPPGFVVTLEICPDMNDALHVGYDRGDVPVFHTITRARSLQSVHPSTHFETCAVCKAHKFTFTNLQAQWPAAKLAFERKFPPAF